MKAFADFALPVLIVIFCVAFAAGIAHLCDLIRQAWKHRREAVRAPFRRRLAAQCREIFGFPFSIPGDGEPLTPGEMRMFAGYVIAEQEKRPYAAEPQYRRQP